MLVDRQEPALKIMQVNDTFDGGGASQVMTELSRGLVANGHQVYFAVGGGGIANNVYEIHHMNNRLRYVVRRLFFFDRDIIARIEFEQILNEIKPDIIHCHNLVDLSLEIVDIAVKRQIPCLVTIHDCWPVCMNRTLLKGNWRKPNSNDICDETDWSRCTIDCKWEAVRKVPNVSWGMSNRRKLLSSDCVNLISVSDYVKGVLERFGYPSQKIQTIVNGVDTSLFEQKPFSPEPIVLYAGGDAWYKGVGHFMALAKRLKKQRPNVRFVMLGSKGSRVQNLVENVGSIPHEDMIDYYSRSRCTCIPTLSAEALGLVALETMACGRPAVAYASGGLSEIIKDQKTGFLCERGNLAMLEEKVSLLIDNIELAEEMGVCAREHVEREYDLKRVVDQYERKYYSML